MRRIFFMLAITASGFLSGCIIYVPDSSICALSRGDEKPFYELKDKELRLQRPVKVYDDILCYGLDVRMAPKVGEIE